MRFRSVVAGLWVLGLGAASAQAQPGEVARWRAEARAVTITRDDWGIAHVHGRTDADAVFGMVYAQAEDDFNRIEVNYLTNLGRLAEAEGEKAVYSDLRAKLYIDPADLKARYASSPASLKALMNAWADGLNYFLSRHPEMHPKALTHFEPWMALCFTEGSIGGDIERISLKALEQFYGEKQLAFLSEDVPERLKEPSGSNGIAIAPALSANHHALLWINPHTSFYFRSELQMTSDAGLNAYGAATWGQFFLYQGFNDRLGWMHTTSGADTVDEFAETIVRKLDGKLFYKYGSEVRPITVSTIVVPYKAATGSGQRTFTVYRSHHGPIVRAEGARWIAEALMFKPVEALSQSYGLTKARTHDSFMRVMALKANSSNNTIYADADGNIAYLHPQFIPRRDNRFDYTHVVDGADPATDWKGLHALDEAPHLLNPPNGWIFNVNDWPYSAAGPFSPKLEAYPTYMDSVGENPRGIHATRLLTGVKDVTVDSLTQLAFDSYLPAFAQILPPLIQAWDRLPANDPKKAALGEQIAVLRGWDDRWAADSVATSLANYWGDTLVIKLEAAARLQHINIYDYMATHATDTERLDALNDATDQLTIAFGTWKTPWGEINRFQRNTDDIVQPFDDAKPSIPVPFASARWGSLASFGANHYGQKKLYGTSGNSFLAAVEFGPRIHAKAVTAGGESGDPASPHFKDQAQRYASGQLREVYFYPDQLKGHTERTYHP